MDKTYFRMLGYNKGSKRKDHNLNFISILCSTNQITLKLSAESCGIKRYGILNFCTLTFFVWHFSWSIGANRQAVWPDETPFRQLDKLSKYKNSVMKAFVNVFNIFSAFYIFSLKVELLDLKYSFDLANKCFVFCI